MSMKSTMFHNPLNLISSRKIFFKTFIATISIYLTTLLVFGLSSQTAICRVLSSLDNNHDCLKPKEINHVQDCRPSIENILPILDRYVVAHFFGWTIKAFILPFPTLLWTASILFEALEFFLIPFLPSLAECWWDSWILDVCCCNATGIIIGYFLRKHWTPTGLNFRRKLSFGQFFVLLIFITITDINAFLIKHVFLLRSASPLNIYRIIFYITLAFLTTQPFTHNALLRAHYSLVYVCLISFELFAVAISVINNHMGQGHF